jgi:hypothetical protein
MQRVMRGDQHVVRFTRVAVSSIIAKLCFGVPRMGLGRDSCPCAVPFYTWRCSSDG